MPIPPTSTAASSHIFQVNPQCWPHAMEEFSFAKSSDLEIPVNVRMFVLNSKPRGAFVD